MTTHRYLRAYLAGIGLPTAFLLIIMTGFTVARYVLHVPTPLERLIVFPMAVVPNLWGVWNMLYLRLSEGRRLSIGAFGAVLPLVLGPLGYFAARAVALDVPPFVAQVFPFGLVLAVLAYYLLWKHVVPFLNRVLEVA
jgi:hypothetical protein